MSTDTKSFILRIWFEANSHENASPIMRGMVEQVGSPKHLYFKDLDRAFSFIQKQVGTTTVKPTQVNWRKMPIKWNHHSNHLSNHGNKD